MSPVSYLITGFCIIFSINNIDGFLEGWWTPHSIQEIVLKNYAATLTASPKESNCLRGENVTITYMVSGEVSNCVTLTMTSEPRQITTLPLPIELCPGHQNSTEIVLQTYHEGNVILEIASAPNDIIYTGDAFVSLSVKINNGIDVAGDVIGWLYTIAWDISFLPQIFLNWRRKSVVGLSFDFITFNLIGFSYYSMFNIGLYWIPEIQAEYYLRNPTSILHVRLNDVIFPLYATLCTLIEIIQCLIYERGTQRVSTLCGLLVVCFLGVAVTYLILVAAIEDIWWLDMLYALSYVKLFITCIKYIPQLMVNYRRKSTVGWSIWQVIFDFTGGALSILQMFLLAYNYDDYASVLKDPTKLGLGLLAMGFNILFFLQHFVIYRNHEIVLTEKEKQKALDFKNIDTAIEDKESQFDP